MLPARVLCYGTDEPLPERVPLRAGPLSLVWEGGDLRTIKVGGREVLRRIYVATRDRNWGTVPNVMSNVVMDVQADAFRIRYDVENRQDDIHFVWHGEIAGEADGTIRFSMDGVAQSTFLKNRIGFCILHPADIAGARCRVEHVDGTSEAATLPVLLVPDQPLLPFAEMAGMAHEVTSGVWAEVRLHRRHLRDGGSAQLDRCVVQDVLHAAAPPLPGGSAEGHAHRSDGDAGAAR